MDRLLRPMLRRLIRQGSLEVQVADEPPFVVGDGSGPPLSVRIADRRAVLALLLNPDLALGELYMDGRLSMQKGDIADLIALGMINLRLSTPPLPVRLVRRWRKWLRAVMQWNRMPQARRNVAHHYDLDGRLYSLFLDADRQYSCAYFETPDQCLDDAQLAKKRHITAKLLVEPGHKVLDIGCGWGGLGLYLGAYAEAEVLGITLSQEQLGVANARAKERNLADKVQFRLQDYRAVEGRFDRIVSVGMFEHVGVPYYQTFFDTVARLLDDDGVMLLHSIGRMEEPGATNSWIAKYIFPGGYIPALSEVLPAIERAGLIVTDIEILRLHYAETLKVWRERFMARRDDVVKLYDERFARMWEFYLAGSEASFRWQEMVNFQIQLSRQRETLPLTRDYMVDTERQLVASGSPARPAYSDAAE